MGKPKFNLNITSEIYDTKPKTVLDKMISPTTEQVPNSNQEPTMPQTQTVDTPVSQSDNSTMSQSDNSTMSQSDNSTMSQSDNSTKKKTRKTDERDRVTYYLDPGQLDKLEELRTLYKKTTGKRLSEQDFMRLVIEKLTLDVMLG